MSGTCGKEGRDENTYKILVGNPEGKKSLGRPRCRRESNNNIDLEEIGGRLWTGFIWLRIGTYASSCEHVTSQ
jgi:hypothetical protein